MSQQPTSAQLAAQEPETALLWLDAEVAWQIGTWLRERAVAAAMPIVIEVSRGEQQLFFCAMPGTSPDNAHWVRRKRNVVMRFHKSSLFIKTKLDEDGRTMLDRYGLAAQDYASSGGGVPIILERTGCVGAVVISGLTQYEDHDLGVAALKEIGRRQRAAMG